MSGIFDQIINYSPPLIVSGTVNYKGTWNASTNNPPLSNPPVASTKGDYYVVSTAGTQFSISFAVGDWIISSGTAWEKVDLTDAVSSVFGRTGAVVGVSTDYSAVGLTNTAIGASSPSTGAFTTVTASSTIAATGAVTGSNLSGTNTGDQTTITGNAGSATILQTARNINGVSFNGSADITVAAAAGTLTGATLASGVTASSLTSLGTIASLVATTADINGGTIDGTTIGATTPSTVAGTTGTFSSGFITNNANSATELTITNTNTGVSARTRLSFVTDLGASAFISYRRAIGDFIIGSDLNIPVSVFSNAAAVGTFTSTGLNSTAIGATTPSTGAFTTLSATGTVSQDFNGAGGNSFTARYNSSNPRGGVYVQGGSGKVFFGENLVHSTANVFVADKAGTAWALADSGGSNVGLFYATGLTAGATAFDFSTTTGRILSVSSTGLAVTGTITAADSSGSFGTISGSYNAGNQFVKLNRIGGTENIAMFADNSTRFTNNNVERVRIDSSGNVGIGTTSPGSKLDVNGELRIGNTVNTVSPTSPNRTVTIVIGGTTYYLAAKTTND